MEITSFKIIFLLYFEKTTLKLLVMLGLVLFVSCSNSDSNFKQKNEASNFLTLTIGTLVGNTSHPETDDRAIDDQSLPTLDPTKRKEAIELLSEIKNISFIRVMKIEGEFHVINPNCVAAENYNIIDNSEELKNSESYSINETYLPIWANDNNEYSTGLITNPSYDTLTSAFYFTILSFEITNDEGEIDLNQKGFTIRIYRSDESYWMAKYERDNGLIYMEEKFAMSLPVTNYSCEE